MKLRSGYVAVFAALALAGCGAAATKTTSHQPTAAPAVPTAIVASPPTATPTAIATSPPTPIPTAVPAPLVTAGDLGSSIADFTTAHGADTGPGAICSSPNSCFGVDVTNDESGATFEFVNTSVDDDMVDGYQMNFPNGTTIADAKAAVLAWLPRDTAATFFAVDHTGGSCGLWNLRSGTLGTLLGTPTIGDPQGVLGVDFSYTDANLNITYNPNNIQDASIDVAPNSLSNSC